MSTTIEERTWKARIRVKVRHEGAQYDDIANYVGSSNEVIIELVQNLRINERSPRDVIHGLEEWNAATVPRPHEFSFSFEIPMNMEGAKLLKYIQRDNRYFDLLIEENQDLIPDELQGRDQFALRLEVLGHAFVEDAPQNFPNVGVPRITFSGRALRAALGKYQRQYGQYPYTPNNQ